MKVAIIGGGAAGFFTAINLAYNYSNAEVYIYEKTQKLLSKVKISGGGRCNVTNSERSIKSLCKAYPRGANFLKKLLPRFSTGETIDWFESRSVPLMVQEDGCVFPVSQDSQSIIDCFLNECQKLNIKILKSHPVNLIVPFESKVMIHFKNNVSPEQTFDKVIIATGGSPKLSGLKWLDNLSQDIQDPVPSLFTFNMPNESIRDLMGVVVENTKTSIQGQKLKSDGPLLITHWGMSGPSILKLSAFGARIMEDLNYKCTLSVNWANESNNEKISETLRQICNEHPQKKLSNFRPYQLPDRLWQYLIKKCEFQETKIWGELGKKGINKLVTILSNDLYEVNGKTTFKEEFVTCGGIDLEGIENKTMRSKIHENIYFAGEVLDIDGITGGYNFQSCWTTGYIAAQLG